MQRYFTNKKQNNTFLLHNDDIYHITIVMRGKEGDKIEVVYNNELYIATICFIDNQLIVKCLEKLDIINNNKSIITLIVPLLKEQKMDYILQKATELNVNRIIPISLNRCIVKADSNKEEKKIIRWQKICKEAAEQSKQLTIPEVSKIHTINEILDLDGINLICSTKNKDNTLDKIIPDNIENNINFIFGPEGGFTENEESLLINNNYIPLTFGSNILRSETTPLYLLSIINYERNKLN